MLRILTIILALSAIGVVCYAQSNSIVVLKDNTLIIGQIITSTDRQIVIKTNSGELKIILVEEISHIQELEGVSGNENLSQKKSSTIDNGKYLKIPLFAYHEPSVKIGALTSSLKFKESGMVNLYGDNESFSLGLIFEIDYSPIMAFTFKYFGASIEGSGIDSTGSVGGVEINGDTLVTQYDLKWSQGTLFMGPKFHYQYSILNAYIEAGVIYTTLSETGSYLNVAEPLLDYEYRRATGAFGFGYSFGVQLITPYSMLAFFEIAGIKAERNEINAGQNYIGGGFQFMLPLK